MDKNKLVHENWPVVRDELKKTAMDSFASGNNNQAINSDTKSLSCGFVSSYLIDERVEEIPTPLKKPDPTNKLLKHVSDQLANIELIETSALHMIQQKCSPTVENTQEKIMNLPMEWTVIQISRLTDRFMGYATQKDILTSDAPIKFTLFRNNLTETVTDHAVDVVMEFKETGDKSILSTAYQIHHVYYKNFSQMRVLEGSSFSTFTNELSALQVKIIADLKLWRGPWIAMFSGKFKDMTAVELERKICQEVDKFATEMGDLSEENILLLKLLTRRIDLLDSDQIKEASFHLATDSLQNTRIAQFLAQTKKKLSVQSTEYYPCILIIDETLDHLPWEMILPQQEFTRFSSLYLLLHSYSIHKDHIYRGYVDLKVTNGSALINPGSDEKLASMRKRMTTFYDVWRPDWKYIGNTIPTPSDLRSLMQECDVFVYSGHGSALQFFESQELARFKTKSILLLMGCESQALKSRGLVSEAYGPPHVYFMTDCPCLLGANTIITDVWTDLVTIMLLKMWIPSDAREKYQFESSDSKRHMEILSTTEQKREPSLPAVISQIRCDKQISNRIRSALVLRGLPVYNNLLDPESLQLN